MKIYFPQRFNTLITALQQKKTTLTDATEIELIHVKTISKHVNNALAQELKGFSVVAKFATTANDGNVYQVDYFNLDMILSVGYRVKSQRGIDFRCWANQVLKNYLLRGYAITQRVEHLEQRMSQTEEKIDFFVRTSLPPVEGIFFEGQIFDTRDRVDDAFKTW